MHCLDYLNGLAEIICLEVLRIYHQESRQKLQKNGLLSHFQNQTLLDLSCK